MVRQYDTEENKYVVRLLRERHGLAVEHIADLFNLRYDYREAIPLLVELLPKLRDPVNKEMVARALSVPWARPAAAPVVIAEYRKAKHGSSLKWALGNAIAVVADGHFADDIVALSLDRSDMNLHNGRARIVDALGRVPRSDAVRVARDVLHDEDPWVRRSALGVIGRRRLVELRDEVASLVDDEAEAVRKTARRVLAGLDRRIAEQAGRR